MVVSFEAIHLRSAWFDWLQLFSFRSKSSYLLTLEEMHGTARKCAESRRSAQNPKGKREKLHESRRSIPGKTVGAKRVLFIDSAQWNYRKFGTVRTIYYQTPRAKHRVIHGLNSVELFSRPARFGKKLTSIAYETHAQSKRNKWISRNRYNPKSREPKTDEMKKHLAVQQQKQAK